MALASLLIVIFLTKEIVSAIGTTGPSYPSQATFTATQTMGTQGLEVKKDPVRAAVSGIAPYPKNSESE